ncbi:MAG: hypothetical protein OXG74_16010 [Acidobacteria bacterium]|nr:hypothetical protein [Acidobacteriota bacterium]
MKLMKHITIALVLCAVPAMALGQVSVTCDECKHMVPIFKGDGGLIAEADGAEMVSYLSECGGITSWGSLTPNSDGVVAMSFQDSGVACMGDDGTFSLGPVMEGGWYWITDANNSAVGSLLNEDVYMSLMDMETMPTNAGPGVETTSGKGAVMVKETATGRVGILSTLLPMTPADPTPLCGYAGTPAAPVSTNCALGDGGNIILATTLNSISGASSRVMDKSMIARPAGTGSYSMTIDLWGNGSGHYTTPADPANDARLGNPAVALSADRGATRMTGVTYTVNLSGGTGPGASNTPVTSGGAAVAGVTYNTGSGSDPLADALQLDIANETTSYCTATARHNATFVVEVVITEAGAGAITPPLARNATTGAVGTFTFTLTCPASSSQQGVELVPENPFPTG